VSRVATLLALVGLALATALILWEGWRAVFQALAVGGLGLVWAALFHVVPMALNARGWQLLLPRGRGRSFGFFTFLVWVREAVDGLLPVARVGGAVASTRLMIRGGIRTHLAVASLVVDTTVSLITQFLFTLVGVALLALKTSDEGAAARIALCVLVALPMLAAFVAVQRFGLFGLGARIVNFVARERVDALAGGARLDLTLRRLYRRRRAVLASGGWQIAGWAAGAGEIWLALLFLGHGASGADALVLQSLTQAVGSAFFVVPGALGVQEAGFVVVGRLLGVGPDVALALALARRVRDVVVFGPGLVAWQLNEAQSGLTPSTGGTRRWFF
jgi:putative membrane protein